MNSINFLSHNTALIDRSADHKMDGERLKPDNQIMDVKLEYSPHMRQSSESLQPTEINEIDLLVTFEDSFGFTQDLKLMHFIPADYMSDYSDKSKDELRRLYYDGYNSEYFNTVITYQRLTEDQIESLFEIMSLKKIPVQKKILYNIFSIKEYENVEQSPCHKK